MRWNAVVAAWAILNIVGIIDENNIQVIYIYETAEDKKTNAVDIYVCAFVFVNVRFVDRVLGTVAINIPA